MRLDFIILSALSIVSVVLKIEDETTLSPHPDTLIRKGGGDVVHRKRNHPGMVH